MWNSSQFFLGKYVKHEQLFSSSYDPPSLDIPQNPLPKHEFNVVLKIIVL